MRAFVFFALFAAAPAFAADPDEPSDRTGLVIELDGPRELFPDEFTRVRATIKNAGRRPARFVIPLDGSQEGVRRVKYEWAVSANDQPLDPKKFTPRVEPFDPKTAPLHGGEVMTLKPGESSPILLPIGVGHFYDLRQPAVYEITLTYSYNPKGPKDVGKGKEGEQSAQEMNELPAATVASAPLRVKVLPYPPVLAAADAKLKAAQARLELLQAVLQSILDEPNATKEEQKAAGERLERAEKSFAEAAAEFKKVKAEFDKSRPRK